MQPQGTRDHPARPIGVSVVTAAFNEQENLPELVRRVSAVLSARTVDWEFIVVDDHSGDATFETIRELARQDPRVRGIRLARNRGSHIAKLAGYEVTRGRCAIGLASDLQDPPELIPQLLEQWEKGAQIVFATRASRPGESLLTRVLSRGYRFLVGTLLGAKEVVRETSSLMLLDRRVLDALSQFREVDPHYYGLLRSTGFRIAEVPYTQGHRLHGSSKWTLGMKLRLIRRTVLSFSPVPLRIIQYAGWVCVLLSIAAMLTGRTVVLIAVLLIGGLQLVASGWIGHYLWTTLEEVRARPRYLVEDSVGIDAVSADG